MPTLRLKLAAGAALLLGTGACADDYYGNGYGYGYSAYGYPRTYGTPYWGWYNNYYYPGTGVYVYDRYRVRRPWTGYERDYWVGRQRGWRGPAVREEWRGFRYVPRGYRR